MLRFSAVAHTGPDEGIVHTTGGTAVRVPWEDVWKAVETSKAVILYLTRNKVIMLPKRELKDMKAVKEMLRRQLPSSKLRFKA